MTLRVVNGMTPAAKVIYIYICYATVRSLARADLRHAPLLYVLWHLYTHTHHAILLYVRLHTDVRSFTCPHKQGLGLGWVGQQRSLVRAQVMLR